MYGIQEGSFNDNKSWKPTGSTTDLRYSTKYARKKNEDHALQSNLDNEDNDECKEPAAAVEDSEPVNDQEKEEVSVESKL